MFTSLVRHTGKTTAGSASWNDMLIAGGLNLHFTAGLLCPATPFSLPPTRMHVPESPTTVIGAQRFIELWGYQKAPSA
jgi:hypothetical protein